MAVTTVVFPLTSHILLGCFRIDEKIGGNPENKNTVAASGTVWAFCLSLVVSQVFRRVFLKVTRALSCPQCPPPALLPAPVPALHSPGPAPVNRLCPGNGKRAPPGPPPLPATPTLTGRPHKWAVKDWSDMDPGVHAVIPGTRK